MSPYNCCGQTATYRGEDDRAHCVVCNNVVTILGELVTVRTAPAPSGYEFTETSAAGRPIARKVDKTPKRCHCGRLGFDGKDRCSDHVHELDYVKQLAARMAAHVCRDDECREDCGRRGKVAEAS